MGKKTITRSQMEQPGFAPRRSGFMHIIMTTNFLLRFCEDLLECASEEFVEAQRHCATKIWANRIDKKPIEANRCESVNQSDTAKLIEDSRRTLVVNQNNAKRILVPDSEQWATRVSG